MDRRQQVRMPLRAAGGLCGGTAWLLPVDKVIAIVNDKVTVQSYPGRPGPGDCSIGESGVGSWQRT